MPTRFIEGPTCTAIFHWLCFLASLVYFHFPCTLHEGKELSDLLIRSKHGCLLFTWHTSFIFSYSVWRKLSVGCASSCGDTSTQLIASTSPSYFLRHHFSLFHFVTLTTSFTFTHLFLYSLNVHCLTSLCSCSNISFFYFWFYNFIVLFMFIIFISTHSTYSSSRKRRILWILKLTTSWKVVKHFALH